MGQFAQAASQVEAAPSTGRCKVGDVVVDFDDEDRAEFTRLARARKVSVISTLISVSDKVIAKHLKGTCRCPEDTTGRGIYREMAING